MPLSVSVFGSTGRMGKMIVKAVFNTEGMILKKAMARPGSAYIGADIGDLVGIGSLGVEVTDDLKAVLEVNVSVDFTLPEATIMHASYAAANGTSLVIGTTGLSNKHEELLANYAKTTAIVYAPNMSLGINLITALVEQLSATLDITWDIEIIELHHNRKVDAPSGTALSIGRAAAKSRGQEFENVKVLSRNTSTYQRKQGDIGFAALRGGSVIGEHTVMFASAGERIEISHKASDRAIFAAGAICAARWVANRPPGLYTMRDVLGID
ncbi:dihydrodipicolinate reductase [Candidatus Endolissoclinum faulkneri L2]|uniref:4-hydroxy-tetrahydrodipicolinate reductase n=1 Tax=Candidatus Endolissoclinum faulkneri L2 TaxID=1193729 RepID=K7YM80_9PROT|nr:4-hydroxy-tetrahydrodipicolinate reductase [Candidatus Endolissoclinum faulkneri]AFX98617.1 dihydrodipicolinate reductase [Candidatus Endolissoclinum faulkneri L2]